MPLNSLSSVRIFWSSKGAWDKALTVLFLAIFLSTIGALIYVLTSPAMAEKYTEFYILGPEGRAENYPRDLSPGQEASVVVGIANVEYKPVSYRLEMAIDDEKGLDLGPISLNHKQKWEKPVQIRPSKTGERQRVEFRLYRDDIVTVYRNAYLFINVKEPTPAPQIP